MKAVINTVYGSPDVLHLVDTKKPTPKSNEVLVMVYASSINFGDIMARNFSSVSPEKFSMPYIFWLMTKITFGIKVPKIQILGSQFAGKIVTVGDKVENLKIGDKVFGYKGSEFGGNAEYVCIDSKGIIAEKPANMSYEEAACVPYGAITALNLLRRANIQKGQRILIIGASGSIGSAAVQIAKYHFGAEVTGICNTEGLEYVKALGADKVIDYSKQDFTKNGVTYDLIFDVLGKSSFSACKDNLSDHGMYLVASFKMKQVFEMLWSNLIGGKKIVCALSFETKEDLIYIKELVELGKFKVIIDKTYPLEQLSQGHRYYEEGHRKGSITVSIINSFSNNVNDRLSC
jgi:NADPH:quinone reductase-like Zn-dependent oxidoreductase